MHRSLRRTLVRHNHLHHRSVLLHLRQAGFYTVTYSSNAYILNALCIFGNLEKTTWLCSFATWKHSTIWYMPPAAFPYNGKHSTRENKERSKKKHKTQYSKGFQQVFAFGTIMEKPIKIFFTMPHFTIPNPLKTETTPDRRAANSNYKARLVSRS